MANTTHSTRPVHPLIATLRERRVAMNLSIRDINLKLGYSYNAVSYLESGKRIPNYMFLIDYAKLLGLEVRLCESQGEVKC
jgi:transcriptional regulator with XRE-family HTH domain